ncbi:hypothetical protein HOY80DRAFT_957559 [Tuber brumale]|nr:hypothetical protein HOY80DRAFT_957559 [Tuber brumale]
MASAWKFSLLPLSFFAFFFLFHLFIRCLLAGPVKEKKEKEKEQAQQRGGRASDLCHTSCSMRNAVESVSGGDFVVNLGKAYCGPLG